MWTTLCALFIAVVIINGLPVNENKQTDLRIPELNEVKAHSQIFERDTSLINQAYPVKETELNKADSEKNGTLDLDRSETLWGGFGWGRPYFGRYYGGWGGYGGWGRGYYGGRRRAALVYWG